MIKTVFDLEIFKLSYSFAMDIFNITRDFPKEERYSLIDQVVRSSRSVFCKYFGRLGKKNL
jgi:four helix bundle protein